MARTKRPVIERPVPTVGQRYRSNDGAGPLRAEVVGFVETWQDIPAVARMVRWNEKTGRRRQIGFLLSVKFLQSQNCGWVPIV